MTGALDRLETEVGELLAKQRGKERDLSVYADDPLGFTSDVLEVELWSRQEDVADAVLEHPRTVVRGCNAAGKDFVAACLALWWVFARGGLVLATGPTQRQVRKVVMKEIRKLWTRAGLPGEMYASSLRIPDDPDAGVYAFTSSEVSHLTGFHAPQILALITEAQAVESYAWEGFFSCAVGEDDRILAVGNPLAPSGEFYRVSGQKNWHALRLPASEHPNVLEGRQVIPGGITRRGVQQFAEEYGRGSSTYVARVEAEFPSQGEESLFSRSWLDAAADRFDRGEFVAEAAETAPIVAVDPARYGPDSTAVGVRRGPVIQKIVTWTEKSLTDTANRVVEELEGQGFTRRPPPGTHILPRKMREKIGHARGRVVVDVVGMGAGVVDQLRDQRFNVVAYNGGSASPRAQDRFLNERAYSHWHLRNLLESGSIALPRNERLFEELLAINWAPTTSGQVQIERKADVKSRLGRSPDLADAVVMAFSLDSGRRWARGPSPWGTPDTGSVRHG